MTENQAAIAVENSKRILQENNVVLPKGLDLAPKWDNAKEDLKRCLDEGLGRKILPKVKTQTKLNEYLQRLKYEYNLICDKGFAEYIMVTKDMVDAARDRDVAIGVGRGSSGGSLVAYLLDITEVDPVRWGLAFERFMSPDRGGYQMAFHDANEISDLIDHYDSLNV
jgi:DNA polymerase-3 subunit alpha